MVKMGISVGIQSGLKMTTKCFNFFQEMESIFYALECRLVLPLALVNRMRWEWCCVVLSLSLKKPCSFSAHALDTLTLPCEKSQAGPRCKRGEQTASNTVRTGQASLAATQPQLSCRMKVASWVIPGKFQAELRLRCLSWINCYPKPLILGPVC